MEIERAIAKEFMKENKNVVKMKNNKTKNSLKHIPLFLLQREKEKKWQHRCLFIYELLLFDYNRHH